MSNTSDSSAGSDGDKAPRLRLSLRKGGGDEAPDPSSPDTTPPSASTPSPKPSPEDGPETSKSPPPRDGAPGPPAQPPPQSPSVPPVQEQAPRSRSIPILVRPAASSQGAESPPLKLRPSGAVDAPQVPPPSAAGVPAGGDESSPEAAPTSAPKASPPSVAAAPPPAGVQASPHRRSPVLKIGAAFAALVLLGASAVYLTIMLLPEKGPESGPEGVRGAGETAQAAPAEVAPQPKPEETGSPAPSPVVAPGATSPSAPSLEIARTVAGEPPAVAAPVDSVATVVATMAFRVLGEDSDEPKLVVDYVAFPPGSVLDLERGIRFVGLRRETRDVVFRDDAGSLYYRTY